MFFCGISDISCQAEFKYARILTVKGGDCELRLLKVQKNWTSRIISLAG